MEARMKNPAFVLSETMKGIQGIYKGIYEGGAPQELLEIVALRTSQINGCSACVHAHVANLKKSGESDERVGNVAAWREAPFYSDIERAALALTEAVTRMADRSTDAVSDDLWNEVADHFDEKQLSAIILTISITNFFNRINATIKEPAGASWA
ncbi:carboxymuconolactone decarboxylase family protein [Nonomuraea rhizosphaerae]|uniref:carboxymuconolactone decarboxylase family protein n=1 Tax=Nonomuraea rhizosphaerae TaxID=2665663 RepID=UPI001C5CF5D9|nr:carboxymuconolactone decarboxylase family protein [Nonomuraea rhizosphaerae]